MLPGIVGGKDGARSCRAPSAEGGRASSASVWSVVLYSGLGWLSGMREALIAVFELPEKEQPKFVHGKSATSSPCSCSARCWCSVSRSPVWRPSSPTPILGWSASVPERPRGLGDRPGPSGLAANTVLFFAFFRLLADPHDTVEVPVVGRPPRRARVRGAQAAVHVLAAGTKDQPACQAFGIALILVVWMNYFSRVVVSPPRGPTRPGRGTGPAERERLAEGAVEGPQIEVARLAPATTSCRGRSTRAPSPRARA